MKKHIKRIINIAILFILFFGMSGSVISANSKTTQSDPYLSKIKKRGYVIVGLSANYAPMEFHATVKGQDTVVGADVSVAKKVAKHLGVKLEVKDMDFNALIGALKTGKIDMIISGMTDTPEREKQVLFSKPYMYEKQAMVIRKNDANKYKGITDFEGPKWVHKHSQFRIKSRINSYPVQR